MDIRLVSYAGLHAALFGMGFSYGLTSNLKSWNEVDLDMLERLLKVAKSLANKDGGHNCFLEQIVLYFDIKAPRYWWQQFDRYKIGTARLSESTMHTLGKRPLNRFDFENGEQIPEEYFTFINKLDDSRIDMKGFLLESFLQRRMCLVSMKALKNMYNQRRGHALPEWQKFCDYCETNVPYFKEWFL